MRSLPYALLVFLALIAAPAAGRAEESPDAAAATVKRATVKRGPLGGIVKGKGVLVPAAYERAKIDIKAYKGELKIIESAPEGPVVKGQVLIKFDDEDYQKDLAARERGFELAKIGLERAERLHALSQEAMAIKQAEVVRAKRFADEAMARFESAERRLREEDAKARLEGREISIKNMREELAQLEAMYKEDDLTEETEEIVLKRNRRNMERMLTSFERYKDRFAYSSKMDLPREHEKLRLAVRKATASLDRLEATEALDMKKAELELVGAREGLEKAEKGLHEFKEDAGAFTLKAPMAGYAVRGTFRAGAWKGLGTDESYEAGESMRTGQTPYTIVDESTMRVHTSVKEADLASVVVGAAASIKTALTGKEALECEVGKVARYGSGGSYAVILRVKGSDARLRAGLGCTTEITRKAEEDVLSLPKACVKSAGGKHFVWVVGEDGKKEVKVGRTDGDRIEILEGLDAGQEVLASPPKEAKADAKKDAAK